MSCSDAELALRLQLEEAGLGSLSPAAMAALLSNPAATPAVPPPSTSCPVCLEEAPTSSTTALGPCGHRVCDGCARKYVTNVAKTTREYPVPCVTCRAPLAMGPCVSAVAAAGAAAVHDVERFFLEKMHMGTVRYCANARCGASFDWEAGEGGDVDAGNFVTCPMCGVGSCVACKVEWHEGKSCAEARAEGGEGGDAAVEALAQANEWRRCPRCEEMIEKQVGDCNFVRCRCRCAFCHRCGVEYVGTAATEANEHGTPSCQCGLWSYEDDVESSDGEQPGSADGHAARAGVAAAARDHLLEAPPLPRLGYAVVQPSPAESPDDDDDDDDGVWGRPAAEPVSADNVASPAGAPSRRVRIGTILGDARKRRRNISNGVYRDLSRSVCPYCHGGFTTEHGLETHLETTEAHDVWVCCGRLFLFETSLAQHSRAKGQHY